MDFLSDLANSFIKVRLYKRDLMSERSLNFIEKPRFLSNRTGPKDTDDGLKTVIGYSSPPDEEGWPKSGMVGRVAASSSYLVETMPAQNYTKVFA
jgi:hypothetical protein